MRSIVVKYKKWLDNITLLSLCSLIFTLPFSKSAVEISFVIAFVSWGLSKLLDHEYKKNIPVLNLPIYLFVLTCFISMCFSASVILSLKGFFFKMLKGVILYLVVAEAVNSKEKLSLILKTMILSMVMTSANGIFQLITGTDFVRGYRILRYYDIHGMRMISSFTAPNGFGGWLIVMIPIALSMFNISIKRVPGIITKVMIWILAFVLIFCLALTRSEGAWVGFVFALTFFVMLKNRRIFLVFISILLVALFIAVPFLVNMQAFSKESLFTAKKHLVSFMLEKDIIRTNLWREALLIVRDFPLFGCGINTYSIVATRYKSDAFVAGIYPHNSYLQMAAEIGIVGLVSFILVLAALFVTAMRNMRKIKDAFYNNILLGLLAGLFGFLVHSFFDVHFYALQLYVLMWFIMGLIIAIQKIALKEERT